MLKLLGYADRYSVAPGEAIAFQVSAEDNQRYQASLVRVICGDCNPEGPGLRFETIASGIDGSYSGARQTTDSGSYMEAVLPQLDQAEQFSFCAMVWPTLIEREQQAILSRWNAERGEGFRLLLSAGVLALEVCAAGDTSRISLAQRPMLERQWYRVGFSIDFDRLEMTLLQSSLKRYARIDDSGDQQGPIHAVADHLGQPLLLAGQPGAEGRVDQHFDGKIDSPVLFSGIHGVDRYLELLSAGSNHPAADDSARDDLLAHWDFSDAINTQRITDRSVNANHGRLVNMPARAMKGWNWDGEFHRWSDHPNHYGAIHFHHDDLYDANWETAFRLTIPPAMKSGAYAVRIYCGDNTVDATRDYYVPFFVRAPRRPKGARPRRDKIAFLAPTASYMAYANHSEHIVAREAERTIGRLLEFGHADLYMYDHPEIGGSLYDLHADGSGVCYSSRLRPVLNFTSQYHSWLGGHGSALWQYNADTHLLAWLEEKGFDYEITTDEDLHFEGRAALDEYRVVLTGTHPEYYSGTMWRGLMDWIDDGGRLMYLGANGFYWSIAFSDDMPGVIEVRRAEDGIRTWMAEPGEYYHGFSGELSGLYRRRGHAPNEVCGLGFIAQGFDKSSYYRRTRDSENPRAAFIFEGVEDEIIGDFGLIGGGAAGLELDCISTLLGSPPNILRLASSENHTQQVMLVNEEFGVVPTNLGGDQNDRVRADLAFYETPSGGAVFSVGSISWCGSLAVNGFDNNVSRITENVLRRFAAPEKFC